MKPAEKAVLYRELAKMTAADFHLDRSVTLLLGQNPRAQRRAFLEGMQRGLKAGSSVAEAIAQENGPLVTALETSMIDAGERSGKLSASFSHLAAYFAAADAARKEAWRAMIYPLVLLHLGIMLPEIPTAIMSVGEGNPGLRVLFTIAIVWILIFIGIQIWRWLSARAQTSPALDDVLRTIPLVGSVRRHWALARFTQVFHAGLLAALRMSELTRVAGLASQSGRLRAAAEIAAISVEAGERVSDSLALGKAFPQEFLNALGTAEEVGTLDEEMSRWAALETETATEAIQRASQWLPKIGYGIIVLYVVYRILGMVSGYYGSLHGQFDL